MGKISSVKEYLEWQVGAYDTLLKLQGKDHPVQLLNGYHSLDDFVLRNGRSWPGRRKPPEIPWGTIKECYRNASNLALSGKGFIYCEGYVLTLLPIMHAWCLNALDGYRVVDNTLRKPADEYFGVAFTHRYLRQCLVRNKYFGLIDDWTHRWPVLRLPVNRWRHPLMREDR